MLRFLINRSYNSPVDISNDILQYQKYLQMLGYEYLQTH